MANKASNSAASTKGGKVAGKIAPKGGKDESGANPKPGLAGPVMIGKGGSNMPETTSRDLVIIVRDAYTMGGVPTKASQNPKPGQKPSEALLLAQTKGMFLWAPDDSSWGLHTASGHKRKLGVKLMVIESAPLDESRAAKSKDAPDLSHMSEVANF